LNAKLHESPGNYRLLNDALTRFVDFLILIPPVSVPAPTLFSVNGGNQLNTATTESRSLLATVLGSRKSQSQAVTSLVCVQPMEPLTWDGTSYELDMKPMPEHRLDLALTFICRVANTISALQSHRPFNDIFISVIASSNGKINFVQSQMKPFLTAWLVERIRDPDADAFVKPLMEYVRTRFAPVIERSQDLDENKSVVYPTELRKPSPALIIYVLKAALTALS
ncbi:hypothetical protein Ciccas_002898, partial [Cichlidogyrus casuarinus]